MLSGPTAFEVSADGVPRFIVYFEDSSAERAIVGNEDASELTLTRAGGGALVSTYFQLFSETFPRMYIFVDHLSVQLRDRDGDGVADGLTGRIFVQDPQNGDFDSTIVGTIDWTAPTLSASDEIEAVPVDAAHPYNVLDQLTIVSSEPLPSGTTLYLDGQGESFPLLSNATVPALGRFVYMSDVDHSLALLPFGAHVTVRVSPRLVDLAGNSSAQELTVDTIPAPATFPEDGFESGVSGVLTGGARVVSRGETSTVPIHGDRSLLLPRGSRATLVLHLDRGDRTVRLQRLGAGRNAGVTVAAIGGSDRASGFLIPDQLLSPPEAGEFTIALPSPFQSPTDTIIVDINNGLPCRYIDSDCGVADFVVDDLVVDGAAP